MRITRLEIFGFKSFMERFVLNFDEPLIGIVGPNGCGKSNIVDALRWVLGETHAKQLRGSVLDDIIFNGSDTRRPLGMAEVSITVRPEKDWSENLGQTDDELEEEPIIASDVEANDDEVEPEELIQGSPESSLANLKEAVPGLFDAAEIQLTRRIYRSGESEYLINRVSCRLRDMTDFYRAIGLGPRGLSIVQQGQIGQIVSKKPTERRQLLEEAAGISGFRVRMEAAGRQLDKTNTNISRLHDIILEVEKQVKTLRKQAKRAIERGALKERIAELDKRLFSLKSLNLLIEQHKSNLQISEIKDVLSTKENELSIITADQEKLRADVEEIDVTLSDVRREREDLNVKISEFGNKRNRARLAKAEILGQQRSVQERLRAIDERKQAIGLEINKRQESLRQASKQLSELSESKSHITSDIESSNDVLKQAEQTEKSITELSKEIETLTNSLQKLQVQSAADKAEVRALEKQQKLSSDDNEGITAISFLEEALGEENASFVYSQIESAENLSHALNAVLGSKANYVISDKVSELSRQYVSESEQISGDLGVIEKNSNISLIEINESIVDRIPSAKRLIDLISVKEQSASAVRALLSHVVLVDSISEGQQLFELLNARSEIEAQCTTAVTPSGELIFNWGWCKPEEEENIFALQPMIDSKNRAIEEAEKSILELTSDKTSKVEEKLKLEETRKVLNEKREHLLFEERKFQAEISKISADIARQEGLVRFEEERMAELRQELENLDQRTDEHLEDEKRLKATLAEAESEMPKEGEDDEQERELLKLQSSLMDNMLELEANRDKIKLTLSEFLHSTDELRREIESLRSKNSNISLSAERVQIELSMLHQDIQNRYTEEISIPVIDFEQESDISVDEQDMQETQTELSKLRARLEREGEVDPEVIEIHQQEEARLEELKKQHEDLQLASKTLDKTIRQLKDVSRKRFLETFESVKTKFEILVPRLYGGGAGFLELVDPEDPLTSGVELTVRPPGKKLRTMELMSGGEKALAATAILIAMFLHRPSPICVLDEVDAPLDDANLERFLDLIREISTSTNFLIITHNKQSMVAVDKLIGITMEEKGVSKALTVDLETAEAALEKAVANA